MLNQTVSLVSTEDDQQIAVWKITDDTVEPSGDDGTLLLNKKQNLLFIHGAFSDKGVCLGIANYFAKLGHQCFIMEWRGHGSSSEPERDYHLEDIALYDIKATFHYLFNQLKLDNLHCVTHSGGGICLTIFLTRYPQLVDKISSISMFACQVFAAATTPYSFAKLLLGKAVTRQLGHVKGKSLKLGTMNESYYLLSQWMDWNLNRNFASYVPTPISQQLAETIAKPIVKPFTHAISKPLSNPLAKPLVRPLLKINRLAKNTQSLAKDQSSNSASDFDYRTLMPNITIPIYLVCAAGDTVAPPDGCLKFLQAFKNSNNNFREFSLANGDSDDYNHTRIFISRHAAKEVWPTVLDWVESTSNCR